MIRLSAITPSGQVHLGNYLGALRTWAREGTKDDVYFISDLHAMTSSHNPQRLRSLTREQFAVLIACGIEPESTCVQSDLIRELGALNWVLECTCTYGEAARMIQFKEKSLGRDSVRLSLLTYPVLMAADILLQGTAEVPVGEDQLQHVELARALARRFNHAYGDAFVVPTAVVPKVGARIKDLSDPARKMDKSAQNSTGVIFVLDDPDLVRRKIRRAVSSTEGIANLTDVLVSCTGKEPEDYTSRFADLKNVVAEAVIEELRPVRDRTLALLADPAELDRIRASGAARARERAQHRLDAALRLSGLN